MAINNKVTVNMDDPYYWYAIVTKGLYSVMLVCDLKYNICYTFGGTNLSICKNIKSTHSQSELYDAFVRKIGKMCKKPVDPDGHYFSNNGGYVSGHTIIPDDIRKFINDKYSSEIL